MLALESFDIGRAGSWELERNFMGVYNALNSSHLQRILSYVQTDGTLLANNS